MTKKSNKRELTPYISILAPFLLLSLVLINAPRILRSIDSRESIENSAETIAKDTKPTEIPKAQSQTESIPQKETNIKLIENSIVEPKTTKPNQTIEYQTTNSIGQLVIDSIGLNASIEEIGTTNNQIDVPAHTVGWYNGSKELSSTYGTSFFDGHSDGIFINLHKVKKGQIISLINNDSTKTYQIETISTESLIGLSMTPVLDYYKRPNRGISLMTCAGTYSTSLGTYTHRLIVYAKLIA